MEIEQHSMRARKRKASKSGFAATEIHRALDRVRTNLYRDMVSGSNFATRAYARELSFQIRSMRRALRRNVTDGCPVDGHSELIADDKYDNPLNSTREWGDEDGSQKHQA